MDLKTKLIKYKEVVQKFKIFMNVNEFKTNVGKKYIFGGDKNQDIIPVEINLPLFDYDSINKTDFFKNQKNYDLSICKTIDRNGKNIVKISVLLKDLYSDNFCEESQFQIILNKIIEVKKRFLIN